MKNRAEDLRGTYTFNLFHILNKSDDDDDDNNNNNNNNDSNNNNN